MTPETPDDGSMPQVEKMARAPKDISSRRQIKMLVLRQRRCCLTKLTADLRSQTTFDFVVGGSYGPANKEYLAWYLDDVELIY